MQRVKKDDWKNTLFTNEYITVSLNRVFTSENMDYITMGVI